MNRDHPLANFTLPGDFRRAAERLFPRDGLLRGKKPDIKAVCEFAKVLGIGIEYQRLLAFERNSEELRTFLDHFQDNLDLLIRKTWVEKIEEKRKEKLQDEIPSFMAKIEQWDFPRAIEEFGAILEELAYLFFGAQSEKEDFTEYTFRIDAQMGLFWWYGSRLSLLKKMIENNGERNDRVLWAVLLLGICYLTNF
jgi:hypothetical protein